MRRRGFNVGPSGLYVCGPAGVAWTPASWGADRVLDYTADDCLTGGGNTTAFVNQVSGGPNATQANAAFQATAPAAHAGLNGALAVRTTADYYNISEVGHSGTSHSIVWTWDNNDAASLYQYIIFANGASFVVYESVSGAAGWMGFYTALSGHSGWLGSAHTGAHRYTMSADGGTALCSGWEDGVSVGADMAFGTYALTGPGFFLGTAANNVVDAYLGRVVLLNRPWTAADETNYAAWSTAKYGV